MKVQKGKQANRRQATTSTQQATSNKQCAASLAADHTFNSSDHTLILTYPLHPNPYPLRMHRQPLAHRSTRSTRSSISTNYDYPNSLLSPAAQVAVARGRSLPTTCAAPAAPAPVPAAARPAAGPLSRPLHAARGVGTTSSSSSTATPLPPPPPPRKLNSLALRDCVPDAHPDDANDLYLVAAYACLRAHVSCLCPLSAARVVLPTLHRLPTAPLADPLRSRITRR